MLISLSRFKHSLYGLGLSDVLGKFFLRIRVKHFLALNTHLLRLAFCYFFSYNLLLFLFVPIFLLHGLLACTVS